MKKIVMIIILMWTAPGICGEIFMWTDANGIKWFSNVSTRPGAKMIGKEINYVAPEKPIAPKITADDRLEMKAKSDQLAIERQKTMQKSIDAQTAAANARAAAFESNAKIIESSRRAINGLLGRPY